MLRESMNASIAVTLCGVKNFLGRSQPPIPGCQLLPPGVKSASA
jgi:hypothetical protein